MRGLRCGGFAAEGWGVLRRVLALIAVCLLAGSLAACGEDATDGYRARFAPVNGDIMATGARFDDAVRTAGSMKNDAAVAAVFATLASDASHMAGTLAAITPPDKLADDHRRLVSGLRGAAGSLDRKSVV